MAIDWYGIGAYRSSIGRNLRDVADRLGELSLLPNERAKGKAAMVSDETLQDGIVYRTVFLLTTPSSVQPLYRLGVPAGVDIRSVRDVTVEAPVASRQHSEMRLERVMKSMQFNRTPVLAHEHA